MAEPFLLKPFEDALIHATRLHAEQTRKETDIPYVSHLLGVASLVLEHGGDEDEAIGALLHDAAEDQGGAATVETIKRKFGAKVADIVAGCSDTFEVPKPPYTERKAAYIRHVAIASPSIRLVSAADKLHNARAILTDLRTVGDALWSRFTANNAATTTGYYRGLVTAFQDPGSPRFGDEPKAAQFDVLVRELDLVVTEIERLAGANAVSPA